MIFSHWAYLLTFCLLHKCVCGVCLGKMVFEPLYPDREKKLVIESTEISWSTRKHRALEAGKMDEQNYSGGAEIFRTFWQSINRDGEEINSATDN